MLVLSRKKTQTIVLDECITITVVRVEGSRVRIGIEAPEYVPVRRGELVPRELADTVAERQPVT